MTAAAPGGCVPPCVDRGYEHTRRALRAVTHSAGWILWAPCGPRGTARPAVLRTYGRCRGVAYPQRQNTGTYLTAGYGRRALRGRVACALAGRRPAARPGSFVLGVARGSGCYGCRRIPPLLCLRPHPGGCVERREATPCRPSPSGRSSRTRCARVRRSRRAAPSGGLLTASNRSRSSGMLARILWIVCETSARRHSFGQREDTHR